MVKGPKSKILVIDDNSAWLDLLLCELGQNHETLGAPSGAEGLSLAQKEIPDLIICDMLLPDTTGVEVVRRLANDPKLSSVPVVMMTGQGLDPEALALVKKQPSVRGFLSKPCSLDAIRDAVRSALSCARPQGVQGPERLGRKILVVDNDVTFIQFMALVLRPDDLLYEAKDGLEGFNRLKESVPDLVVFEMLVPGMDGLEFLRAVAREGALKRIPVILVTGNEQKRSELSRQQRLFDNLKGVLLKPCSAEDMRRHLEGALVVNGHGASQGRRL